MTLTLTVKGRPRSKSRSRNWATPRPHGRRNDSPAREPSRRNQRATWSQVIRLKQVKPGVEPVPDVSVRFRDGPDATWEKAEWVDILKQVRGLPPPPDRQRRRRRGCGAGGSVLLVGICCCWWGRG